jgi:hypothetical protein
MRLIYIPLILILFLLPAISYSQVLSNGVAEEFIQSLIEESEELRNYVLPDELQLSEQLNITYDNVKHKFLISYDIDPLVKSKIINEQLNYEYKIVELLDDHSRLEFIVPSLNYKKDFYFKGEHLISPIHYHTQGWKQIESEHFIFVISDPSLFNSYCVDNLEKFYEQAAYKLELNDEQFENIRSNKIYYFLCKDEDEIKKLTGYRARGLNILAYDYVVTTFNNHYHELMHLLINYKLQKLPLYTHPFFQEGFAVAFGGRGGKEPKVILDLGLFLQKSNMLNYTSLLSKNDFYKEDVTLSYPLSGLYNLFLINELGVENYLKLYLKYSGSADEVGQMVIPQNDLPSTDKWESFLDDYSKNRMVELENEGNDLNLIYEDSTIRVLENSTHYFFQMKDVFLIPDGNNFEEFQSKKFNEVFKDRKYSGDKYLITANANEVAIYNLYTNNLIANFVSSFSVPMKTVPEKNGYFEFYVLKSLFDEPLSEVLN